MLIERGELAAIVLGYLRQLKVHFGLLPQGKSDSLILQELVVADEVFTKASRAQDKVVIRLRFDYRVGQLWKALTFLDLVLFCLRYTPDIHDKLIC